MKIKKIKDLDSIVYILEINQAELDELRCGLGWSNSEGCALDFTINETLQAQLKEYETKEQ